MTKNGYSTIVGGCLAAAASSVAVGSAVAANSYLSSYPVAYSQAFRYGLAAIILWGVARFDFPKLRVIQVVRLVLLALSGLIAFNVFMIAALRIGDAGTVGAIIGAVPVVLAIVGPFLVRRKPTWIPVLSAVIVVCGAAVVHGVDGTTPMLAVVWAVLAMLGEAGFSLFAVPLIRDMKPVELSMSVSVVGAVLLLLYGILFAGVPVRMPTAQESFAIVYLAVVPTAGAFVLWYSGLARIPMETAGLFAGIVPVSALLTSTLVGATNFTWLRFAGVALVAVGVIFGVRANRSPKLATSGNQARDEHSDSMIAGRDRQE